MTTTTYSTSNSSTFAGETLNSTSGLRLDLFLALSDGSVVINVDEYNTLDTSNNVSAANHWRYFPNALSPYNDCGASGPLGFAVFQGYYDSSNYTSGTALALYNTTYAMSCTATLYPTTSYVFNPQSDVATAYNAVGPVSPFETNASVSLSFTTYG